MKDGDQGFTAVHGPHAVSIGIPRGRRRRRRAAFTGLLVVTLLAAANWVVPGAPGSPGGPAPLAGEAPRPNEEFAYFPAQYVNQATEPTEHIQAF